MVPEQIEDWHMDQFDDNFIMLFDTPNSHFLSLYETSDQNILKKLIFCVNMKEEKMSN